MSYLGYLSSSGDLITSPEEIRAGFVALATVIADSMAKEIWNQLEDGTLKNAANLTKPDQVAFLSNWLVDL